MAAVITTAAATGTEQERDPEHWENAWATPNLPSYRLGLAQTLQTCPVTALGLAQARTKLICHPGSRVISSLGESPVWGDSHGESQIGWPRISQFFQLRDWLILGQKQRWLQFQGQTMFLLMVLFGFLTPLLGPGQISFRYPESRGQVCSFGASFRFMVLLPGSMLRGRVSLLLTWVPK